jgi:hypothetical protein
MKDKQRALKEEYQRHPPPLGVFLIRNTTNNKIFLAGGINLPGIMNSQRFQLENGGHRNSDLQRDWNELGASNFAFEIVDQLDRNGRFVAGKAEAIWRAGL